MALTSSQNSIFKFLSKSQFVIILQMNIYACYVTLFVCCAILLSNVMAREEYVGEVCELRSNNSIPYFCRGCTDRFEGLGYNPWIRVPRKPGLLIKYKLKELENNSCKLYNPAATCTPNWNLKGINFTMGGEGDSYLYVNFTDVDSYNFINFTIYIQCHYHNPPFCFLVTFVENCPRPEGLTMAAKISITVVSSFIAIIIIIVILCVCVWLIRLQYNRIPRNNTDKKMHKYVQMD
ncbi:hypothetical protein LOD99_2851 [Oopsacas minuta]|uniref:Uncharacterized protein n=1 Tax=Oopsacas minuta TaxID=111878 RepID=A0AAV7K174_9METZ|nr:hypothetical protein LOD99_2851 [Oopsacas minuta]